LRSATDIPVKDPGLRADWPATARSIAKLPIAKVAANLSPDVAVKPDAQIRGGCKRLIFALKYKVTPPVWLDIAAENFWKIAEPIALQ
jgi:hypothetical protein